MTVLAPELISTPEPGSTPAPETCLRLYRRLAAGVTIVTAPGDDGMVGMTASSVTSVSLTPPLLLVSLGLGSRTLTAVRDRAVFAVHLLRDDQRDLAITFAQPGVARSPTPLARTVLGAPVLPDALGWAVCRLEGEHRYGDHSLVVGRVLATDVGAGQPLLWHNRSFRALTA